MAAPRRDNAKTAANRTKAVQAISHEDKRVNNPTADAIDLVTEDVEQWKTLLYPRDPSLDPQLVWKGKDEQDAQDLEVPAPPIFRQELIEPRYLVKQLMDETKRRQNDGEDDGTEEALSLFGTDFFDDGIPDELEKIEWYKHQMNWTNRMILGDSLQVMASLAERENLRGKVQMVYIDPPYGIKFNSNWQVSARSRDVKDGNLASATREVEQLKAFRDTWDLGIHSYLAYLRDRLLAARDLLTESGSVFLQIGDENVHLARTLLDEVFGVENFVTLITVKKTSTGTGDFLASVSDYVIWYAKDRSLLKYRQIYKLKSVGGEGASAYNQLELPDGRRRRATKEEREDSSLAPTGARFFRPSPLTSDSVGREKGEGAASWFPVIFNGQEFLPSIKVRWKTNEVGMSRLKAANRLVATGRSLNYLRYLDDFPAYPINNLWEDTQSGSGMDKIYVVQTNTKVVERCMLMATDPGDLTLDPTCGSGTTAYVAEQWGRRWITIDSSRRRHPRQAPSHGRQVLGLPPRRLPGRKGQGSRTKPTAARPFALEPRHPSRLRLRARPAHYAEVDREQP